MTVSRSLKEQMRDMIVCDSLSGCGVDVGLFSYNKRPSFLVGKLSGREFMTLIFFWRICF